METPGRSDASPREVLLGGLEAQVAQLIRSVRSFVIEAAHGIDPHLYATGYLTLAWLSQQGPIRQTTIAEEFSIDKGAVSRLLTHLEELGLVERRPDPADGRARLVAVSELGRRKLDETVEHRRPWVVERLQGWPDEQLAAFVALLGDYNAAISQG